MKLKRFAPAVGLAAAVALTATACGAPAGAGGGDSASTEIKQSNTTPAAKSDLDSATWLIAKEPKTMDLADGVSTSQTDIVMSNVCEKLVQIGPEMVPTPSIATGWEWKDDNTLVWTITPDATFHNGDPVTADDVVWSMKRNMADGAAEQDKFVTVKSIEKTGKNEVTFHTSQRDSSLVVSMAGGAGIVVSQKMLKEQGKNYGKTGGTDACSGPYELTQWKSGTSITLTKYDDYWNKDRAAHTKQVVIKWGDDDAVVNSLLTGEADGAYLENLASATRLNEDENINVTQGQDTRVWSLMATERGALKDERLRQALSLAIDRPGINEAALSGMGEPWKEPMGGGAWGNQQETYKKAYDELEYSPLKVTDENIEKAKKLVKEVGTTEEIVVATDGEQIRSALAEAVVTAAEKIGLKAKIIRIPPQQYSFYSDPDIRQKADLFSDDYFISTWEPLGFYKNGASNSSVEYVYKDKKYDETLKKARAATDPDEHAKYSIELAQMWNKAQPWISVVATPSMVAYNKDVTGIPAAGTFRYYPWAADLGATQ